MRQDAPANVLRLILGGFDPNTLDAEGNTGLTLALSESSLKVAEVFLALDGVDVEVVNKAGWNALALAALRGHEEAVRRLIERKVEVPKNGLTPLHHAARGGHVPVMRLLLQRGSSVDALGPRGNTPLMLAAGFGNAQAVQFLLEAGAQARLKNQLGYDALDLAHLHGRADSVKLLAPLVARGEAVARLPARRPSAATQTPALATGPLASINRPSAPIPSAATAEPATAAEAGRQSPAQGSALTAVQASWQSWVGAPMRALRQALTAPAAVANPTPVLAAPASPRGPEVDGRPAAASTAAQASAASNAAAAATASTAVSATGSPAAQRAGVPAPSAAIPQAPRRIVFVPSSVEPKAAEGAGPRTGW